MKAKEEFLEEKEKELSKKEEDLYQREETLKQENRKMKKQSMERSRRRIERSKLSFFNKTNDMNQKMKRRSLLCETIDRDSFDESEEEFSDHDKSSCGDSTTSEKEIKSDVIQESSKKERKEDIQRRESISVIEKEKLLATICEIQSIKNHLVDSFAKMKKRRHSKKREHFCDRKGEI